METLQPVFDFVLSHLLKIWPFLLVTIPIAAAVNLFGAAQHINRAFQARPIIAIFLATAVGAFSPLCSCTVIPVIASLLIGGVPLAPVMSFWVASPSMDPEIFFLSVATLGWEMAVWRLAATLVLSLAAGFAAYFLTQCGWLGDNVLRARPTTSSQSLGKILQNGWRALRRGPGSTPELRPAAETISANIAPITLVENWQPEQTLALTEPEACCPPASDAYCPQPPRSLRQRLLPEVFSATLLVAKFMALAFFLEALMVLYIPRGWVEGALGARNPWAILTATLIGVPMYTTNLAALPLVGGLLQQGMNPAAGLAFLVAGAMTTLPAMAAVWGLTPRRVFALYLSVALVGAVTVGHFYNFSA